MKKNNGNGAGQYGENQISLYSRPNASVLNCNDIVGLTFGAFTKFLHNDILDE